MGMIEVKRSIRIDKPADAVWSIVSDSYADVGQWATSVDRSVEKAGDLLPGAPVNGRVCTAPGFGDITETIIEHDNSLQTLTFEASASKIPGFVKNIRSRWSIRPTGPNTSEASIHLTANATGVMGAMMGPMMKRKFSTTMDQVVVDLKDFAETGAPSAAKAKALARA